MAVAGTLSTTCPRTADRYQNPVKRYVLTWESDASGNVTDWYTPVISGEIVRVVFNPSADAPTDNYDVTLTDEQGVDVLMGLGANLDTVNTSNVRPGISFTDGVETSVAPVAVDDKLLLSVTNAGDSNDGVIVLYVR